MMKRIVGAVTVLSVTLAILGMAAPQENENATTQASLIETSDVTAELLTSMEVTQTTVDEIKEQEVLAVCTTTGEEVIIQDSAVPLVEGVAEANKRKTILTDDEITLLEKVVSAEARGESFEAQYDVACVVLNRMESGIFPNSLEAVVMEYGQFSCVANGAIYCVPITESVKLAVASALDNNTLSENVLWFRSDYYHSYRPRAFQIGRLFFST